MKGVIITALKTGKTRTKKSLAEIIGYLYPLAHLFTTNEDNLIVENRNPFWSIENTDNRVALICDIKAIKNKNMKDNAYFRLINRFENGDGYGIEKTYYEKLVVEKEELNRYKTLLDIKDLLDLDYEEREEIRATEFDTILLNRVRFNDNRYIALYLCSGYSHYYVHSDLHEGNGELIISFTNSRELSDCMEYTYNNKTYSIEIVAHTPTNKTCA